MAKTTAKRSIKSRGVPKKKNEKRPNKKKQDRTPDGRLRGGRMIAAIVRPRAKVPDRRPGTPVKKKKQKKA